MSVFARDGGVPGCPGCGGGTLREVMAEMGVPDVADGRVVVPNAGLAHLRVGPWQKVDEQCRRWLGTPWAQDRRLVAQGVDCVNLVAGVYDGLFGNAVPTVVPALPPEASQHVAGITRPVVAALVRAFDLRQLDGAEARVVNPGDIGVVRSDPRPGAPGGADHAGHALIAGNRAGRWLHVMRGGVVGWTSLVTQPPLIALYRSTRRDVWDEAG